MNARQNVDRRLAASSLAGGFGVLLLATATATSAMAGERREAGAHVHGTGALNMVISGNALGIELEAPGADIVGFEHEAKTKKQKAAVAEAKKTLADPVKMFGVPADAKCTVGKTDVKVEAEEHDHGHGEKKKHKHGHDHGHSHGHSHDDGGHSSFKATYELTCEKPESLTAFSLAYFKAFPKAEKLEIAVVTDKGQSKYEVTRAKPDLVLQGLM